MFFDSIIRASLFIVGVSLCVEGASIALAGTFVSAAKLSTLLLLMMGLMQFSVSRNRFPGGIKSMWLAAFALALALGGVYSFLQGVPIGALQGIWAGYPGLLALYFLLSYLLSDTRRLDTFLAGVVAGMLLASLLSFLGVQGLQSKGESIEGRLSGVGGNTNEIAYHLVIAISISLSFFATAVTSRSRRLSLGSGIFLFVALVATVSRSGMLAAIVMGVFWMFRFGGTQSLKYALPALALIPVVIVLALPEGGSSRLANVRDDSRMNVYKIGVSAFASNPLIGIGPVRFVQFANERGHRIVNTVHNIPLKLLAEHGILGFVPFAMFVFLCWRSLTRVYRYVASLGPRGDPLLLQLGWRAGYLQIGFLGVLVIAQFQPQETDKLQWALFGLCTAVENLTHQRIVQLKDIEGFSEDEVEEPPGYAQYPPAEPAPSA